MQFEVDAQGRRALQEVISDFLAFVEKVQRESDARCAESGEKPKPLLIGVDTEHPTLALVDPSQIEKS
jgi:hypothetical protein